MGWDDNSLALRICDDTTQIPFLAKSDAIFCFNKNIKQDQARRNL